MIRKNRLETFRLVEPSTGDVLEAVSVQVAAEATGMKPMTLRRALQAGDLRGGRMPFGQKNFWWVSAEEVRKIQRTSWGAVTGRKAGRPWPSTLKKRGRWK